MVYNLNNLLHDWKTPVNNGVEDARNRTYNERRCGSLVAERPCSVVCVEGGGSNKRLAILGVVAGTVAGVAGGVYNS